MAQGAKHREVVPAHIVFFQTFAFCRCVYRKAGRVLSRQAAHRTLMCQLSLAQDFSLLLIFISGSEAVWPLPSVASARHRQQGQSNLIIGSNMFLGLFS